MSMKIIAAAIIGLMLVVLPIGYVQNVKATQVPFDGGGGAGGILGFNSLDDLLNWALDFVTGRLPLVAGDLLEVAIHFIFASVTIVQSILAMILNPQGIPLLMAMFVNGVVYAFNYGITFAIYGGILGTVVPILGNIIGFVLGAMAGVVFGFVYGFVNASSAELPDTIENPWLESWPEGFVS